MSEGREYKCYRGVLLGVCLGLVVWALIGLCFVSVRYAMAKDDRKPTNLEKLRKIILEDIDDDVRYTIVGGDMLDQQMFIEWITAFERNVQPHNTAISSFLSIPGLRAYWPCSSVDELINVYDLSGQARTLTSYNSPTLGLKSNMSFVSFDGADQYLERADEDGLETASEITLGGWFYLNDASGEMLMHKWSNIISSKIYMIYVDVWGSIQFGVNNSIVQTVYSSGTNWPLDVGEWHFIVVRYKSGVQEIFVDGQQLETTGTPATGDLNVGTGAFQVARYLTGYSEIDAAHLFLAADYLSDDLIFNLWYVTQSIFK
ncbi:LamG-like jellyroll fold domain-containing protein [Chloroflexota bacterium]